MHIQGCFPVFWGVGVVLFLFFARHIVAWAFIETACIHQLQYIFHSPIHTILPYCAFSFCGNNLNIATGSAGLETKQVTAYIWYIPNNMTYWSDNSNTVTIWMSGCGLILAYRVNWCAPAELHLKNKQTIHSSSVEWFVEPSLLILAYVEKAYTIFM